MRTAPGHPVTAGEVPPPQHGVPHGLTSLGELERALAPLGQAHDGHHLGPEAAASFLGGAGPGAVPGLLGPTDFPTDAGAPNHVPGGRRRGRNCLPVKHGPRGGRTSGNPAVGGAERKGSHIRPRATRPRPQPFLAVCPWARHSACLRSRGLNEQIHGKDVHRIWLHQGDCSHQRVAAPDKRPGLAGKVEAG